MTEHGLGSPYNAINNKTVKIPVKANKAGVFSG
jgi:hypothetical protein